MVTKHLTSIYYHQKINKNEKKHLPHPDSIVINLQAVS